MAIAYMNRYSTPCIEGCCTRCPVAVCHCVHRSPFWGSCGISVSAMAWLCCHILAGFPTTGFQDRPTTNYHIFTIGILLCKEKKDALIKLTLPEDANIYATECALYLPDKKELQDKLQQWIQEFDEEGR